MNESTIPMTNAAPRKRRRTAKPAGERVVSPAMQRTPLPERPADASTTPSPVMLPELPDDSVEREVVLRSLAERVARYHGPTTARFLASLLDEAADAAEEEEDRHERPS